MRYFTLASGAHTTLRLSGFPPLSGVPFSLTVYTYAARGGRKRVVVVDGQEQERHDRIAEQSLVFSPDSRRLAYVVRVGKKVEFQEVV